MAVTAKISGGDKLQKRLEEILKQAQNSQLVNVGFLEGATYPDGTPVAQVAAINEYGREVRSKEGNYYQLPRPFFRGMIANKKSGWGKSLGNLLKSNNYDAHKALALMGYGIGGQLQESIQQLTSPPLAESTIKAKGGTATAAKPLIDTGHMFQSVDFEVKT